MLEAIDIQKHEYNKDALVITFSDQEDDVLNLTMKTDYAIDMAEWIIEYYGKGKLYTLEEAKKILMKEMAKKV